MILLHRITPAAIATVSFVGLLLFLVGSGARLFGFVLMLFAIPLLLGRLLSWEVRRPAFWIFFGVPMVYFASALIFYLFIEQTLFHVLVAMAVAAGLWLYTENLFAFYHLPRTYQAYSLEYLSLVLATASLFFFGAGAYAAQLFLQLPFWVLGLGVFWLALFLTMSVFWVSKIGAGTNIRFASVGALLMFQLYVALAFLPTSFLTNAAVLTVVYYLFLGTARAQALDKLSKTVRTRYLVLASLSVLLLFLTARWV